MGGIPIPKVSAPYLFSARVLPIGSDVSLYAVLRNSVGGFWSLDPDTYVYPGYIYRTWGRNFDQTSLDSACPAGEYVFQISSGSENWWVTNHFTPGTFPNAPSISNLAEAQAVNSTNDFTLTWNPFSGGELQDFILLEIISGFGPYFVTPVPGSVGALDGTATSAVIPANALRPGRASIGRLLFAKVQERFFDPSSGATSVTCHFSQTDFWVRTMGGTDNVPPSIAWTTVTNGAINMPSNIPIGIYFTEKMGFVVSSMRVGSPAWPLPARSDDGMEIVLAPTAPYEGGVSHMLVLNPIEFAPSLDDYNGNPLAAETLVTTFTVGATTTTPKRGRLFNPHWDGVFGIFTADMEGEPDYSYTLEVSTNLTNWSVVGSHIAFGGKALLFDLNAPASTAVRAYRAVAR
jgi:hypothetical protein